MDVSYFKRKVNKIFTIFALWKPLQDVRRLELLIMKAIFEESYFLSAGECNAEREMSLPILVAKIIDIATAHANSLGIGNPSMEAMHAGWVLSRLTIDMTEYPKVNDNYVLTTWIESYNRHYSERAFRISSPDGKVYGYARSIWMVMDTVNRTNVGLSHLPLDPSIIDGTKAPIPTQARHSTIVESCDGELPRNTILANKPTFDYRFKYCDLDFYRHVNTIRYVTLLLNRFTLEEHDERFARRLELSFMHEARYGMETQLMRTDSESDGEDVSAFLLQNKADSSPLFFARLFRKKRE